MTELYTALDIESYQIRILRILPGAAGSIVRCELKRHALVDPPSYSALSYCWGDESKRRPILVNNIQVAVTINLADALEHLREIGTELIWADALCINQTDNQEKSFQVRNMKQIYAKAETTYAWLGGSDQDCAAAAISFLREVNNDASLLHNEPFGGCKSKPGATWTSWMSKNVADTQLLGMPVETEAPCRQREIALSFEGLVDLCDRPYWRRRWIIQEITVASDSQVVCGGEIINFDEMVEAMKKCSQSHWWKGPMGVSYEFLRRISTFRKSYQEGTPLKLCNILLETQTCLSKDDRGKIYALLGICADSNELIHTASYHLSPEAVAIHLTRELIRQRSCLDIITTKQKSGSTLLPTWCPDWLSCDNLSRLSVSAASIEGQLAHPYRIRMLKRDIPVLYVQGIDLGRVQITSTAMHAPLISLRSRRYHQGVPQGNGKEAYYGKDALRAILSCLLSSNTRDTRVPIRYLLKLWLSAFLQGIGHCTFTDDTSFDLESGSIENVWAQWIFQNGDLAIEGKTLNEWLKCSRICSYWIAFSQPFLDDSLLIAVGFLSAGVITVAAFLIAIYSSLVLGEDMSYWWTLLIVPLGLILIFGSIILAVGMIVVCQNAPKTRDIFKKARRIVEEATQSSRRLIITENGMLGMACCDVAEGDRICFIAGCTTAAVLRPAGTSHGVRYTVVGTSMVCLSRPAAGRYKAWCNLEQRMDYPLSDKRVRLDDKEYNELMEHYETYEEWKSFVLV